MSSSKLGRYQEAAQVLPTPKVMCLSTCGKDTRPSSRMVALTDCDKNGVKFFTDERSKKGQEMKENPYVSAVQLEDVICDRMAGTNCR